MLNSILTLSYQYTVCALSHAREEFNLTFEASSIQTSILTHRYCPYGIKPYGI